MGDERQLRDLIRLIYESSIKPGNWKVFLAEYANAVGAHAAGLMVYDQKNQRGNLSGSVGFDPVWEAKYAEYYSSINVWLQAGRHLLIPGRGFVAEQAVPTGELMKTEFYNDFLKPQGHLYSMGGTIIQEGTQGSYLTAQRGKKAGTFSVTHQELLDTLLPHLETALRVHYRVALLEEGLLRASGALDELRNGLILSDAKGRVLLANRRAEALLQSRDGMSVNGDGLRAGSPAETAELRRAIQTAATAFQPGHKPPTGLLLLRRPSGRDPLRLFVAPLPPPADGSRRSPAVVIFVTALEWYLAPQPAVFERLLDLTPAEARLAFALAQGKSLQDYTREAGVTLNTTRTHLKRMYGKLGVTRQPELMRILLSLVPDAR